MSALRSLSDAQLVERLPALVQLESHAMVDVIEHLVEMERRRLYLSSSCPSLYRYCIDRLGYAEDAALNRHRVAQLALRLPQVLDELRARTIHMTGIFLLSKHLTADNAAALLSEARGKSRREIEKLIALIPASRRARASGATAPGGFETNVCLPADAGPRSNDSRIRTCLYTSRDR